MKYCSTYLIDDLCRHSTSFTEHVSSHARDSAMNNMGKLHALLDSVPVGRAGEAQNKYVVGWMVLGAMEENKAGSREGDLK